MALCRFEAKIISRAGGRSTVGAASYRTGKCATSAAAYRAGAQLTDERTGQTYDYTRKRGITGAEIMLPEGAPDWMRDRGQLWNAVEKAEKRADAQLARDYILTLPHELDAEQRRDLTRQFVRAQFVDRGFVADIAWHAPHGKGDERNHHAHVMVVMRRIEGNGFAAKKERPPPGKHPAEQWKADLCAQREAWANAGADALEAAGFHQEAERFRLGHLTLDKQREAAIARGDLTWAEQLDREAEPKQGPLATKIEQEGRESHAGNDRREVQARNAARAALKAEHAAVSAEIISLEDYRRKRQMQHDDPLVAEGVEANERLQQTYRDAQRAFEAEIAERERLKAEAERLQREKDDADRKKVREEAEFQARIDAGDIVDAQARAQIALGRVSSFRNPYETMAEAAAKEQAIFLEQQQALRDEAAREQDPEARRLIEMRREIEAREFYALQLDKNANITRSLSGHETNTDIVRDEWNADRQREEAGKLRQQRAALQKETRQREASEGWARVKAAIRGQDPDKEGERVRQQQRDDQAKREGLRPDQPLETAPPTKEAREQARREEAVTAWQAAKDWRSTGEERPQQGRGGGRPAGRGGGRGGR